MKLMAKLQAREERRLIEVVVGAGGCDILSIVKEIGWPCLISSWWGFLFLYVGEGKERKG